MDQLRGRRKGLMFTLVTVVIVVLMLGEVLTYLYTNTQYSNLGVQATPSQAASTLYSQIGASSSSFLQTSLVKAAYALDAYEDSNMINRSISSGAYALESLIDNGTLYGTNMGGYMGGYTLSAYSNTLKADGIARGLNVTVSNANAIVFQDSGGSINATLLTLLNVTSQYGSVVYPIRANASVPISGLPDLFGGDLGSVVSYSTAKSFVVSNTYATFIGGSIYNPGNGISNSVGAQAGSLSAYLFAQGPLFIDNSVQANCGDGAIRGASNKASYILATPNAVDISNIVCGFAGLITYHANATAPVRPFLVFNSPTAANIIGDLRTGGSYIIDGNSLTLSDPAGLQASVYNGSYVPSGFAPTYLSLISGSQATASPYGDAPLGIASRYVASFPSTGNITASGVPVNTVLNGINTVSFWMQWPGNQIDIVPFSFNGYSIYVTSSAIGFSSGGGNLLGTPTYGQSEFSTTPWVSVVAAFSNNVPSPSNDILYVNGVRQSLAVVSGGFSANSFAATTISVGGFNSGAYSEFRGQVADVQVYNSLLDPYQAEAIYLDGINSAPINYSSLAGWWPLNGNANDYSRYHDNGVVAGSVSYSRLSGYAGDTLDGGAFYAQSVDGVEGISQCYSRGQCPWSAPGKVYVPVQQSYQTNSVQPASSSLGFANNTMPSSAYFDAAENAVYVALGVPISASDTVSFWMDMVNDGGTMTMVYLKGIGSVAVTSSCLGVVAPGGSGITGIATPAGSRWINVVVEMESTPVIYLNGTQQANSGSCTGGGTLGSSPSKVYIGGLQAAGSGFSGSLADVQVYNTLLTSAQIGQLYLNNSVPNERPAGWWPLGSNYNGYNNQTGALAGSVAYEYSNGNVCLEASSMGIIGSQCGISYLPFGVR